MAQVIKPSAIGLAAEYHLRISTHILRLNSTSSGVFFKTSANRIIFLTDEVFQGPLNIITNQAHCLNISEGTLSNNSIIFNSGSTIIDYTNSKRIRTPEVQIPQDAGNFSGKFSIAFKHLRTTPFISFLDFVINSKSGSHNPLSTAALNIHQKLVQKKDVSTEILDSLGTGSGLTPNFDDFISGLIFVKVISAQHSGNKSLLFSTEMIVREAFSQTNLVSASLIEAASMGEVDHRLVNLLKFLVLSSIPAREEKILQQAFSWGNSSGEDFFAGMVLGLTLLTSN